MIFIYFKGHNGAGKTTLINIMVGLVKASYGDIYFDGRSISSDLNKIRKDFGVCAQNNIIYDEFTVEDHIKFYANLKNVIVDVDEVLNELDLSQQKKLKAIKLSGGQKRKLCIGMAIIGNPKYIFLDEPTTGLDPLSRRKIWDLLIKKKEGRVIFLTTHYMDEADILADRKLILSRGKIRCLGTSLYLKNHFNMRYILDVETENKDFINHIIKNYIPDSICYQNEEDLVLDNANKCYTWKLPLNSTNNFSALLNELDNQKKNNIIQKYALSMPTLEELFIRLEDDVKDPSCFNETTDERQHLIQTETGLPKLRPISKPTGLAQILCLVKFRLKIFLKDKAFAFNYVMTPIIIAAVCFYSVNKIINNTNTKTKSVTLSVPSMYSNTLVNYDSNSSFNISSENMIDAIGDVNHLKLMTLDDISFPKSNENYYLSSVFGEKLENNTNVFKIYYNETMTHSIPATFNCINNAILSSRNINDRIVTKSHPFNVTNDMMILIGLAISGMVIGMCLVIPLSKFGPMVTHERVNQILQQLQLNGVSRFNYWTSCFFSDYLIFISISIFIIFSGVIVKFEPLLDVKTIVIIYISLFIWSVPTLLYQYVLSFFFKREETTLTFINLINSNTNILGFMIFSIIDAMGNSKIENILMNGTLYSIFPLMLNVLITAIVPTYGIICILNSLFNIRLYSRILKFKFSISNIIAIKNGITPIILTLLVLIFVYYYVLIKLDQKKNQTNKEDINELHPSTKDFYENTLKEGDDDVFNEFEFVRENQNKLPISVIHLSKEFRVKVGDKVKKSIYIKRDEKNLIYGQIHRSTYNGKFVKTAVVDVNFGVRNHECFGLLGPNGAGKSTTLNTITSTIPQTTGTICFNGIETHIARLSEISMGYCPQKDILWKELTLREHIELFLTIRGYSNDESKEYASQYIKIAGLEEHQNKLTENLSGVYKT